MTSNDPLSGEWYSGVGSRLVLAVNGSTLTGHFQSTDNPGAPAQPVYGSVNPDTSLPNRALSFSVYWPKSSNFAAAVTSYTGQYQAKGGPSDTPQITSIFLLSTETEPKDNYKAVNVGFDIFERRK